jgi:hypothetical protein
MAKTTMQYLIDNEHMPISGLKFTINDYLFVKRHKLQKIIINEGKGKREEVLTKEDIVNRIKELYIFQQQNIGRKIVSDVDINLISNDILNKELGEDFT